MKKFLVLLAAFVFFTGVSTVDALNLGTNITTWDQMATNEDWHGVNEDQEVEPDDEHGQKWDLEAFFLDGTTLSLVGGVNFIGPTRHTDYWAGDIFIDVDGDMQYGPVNDGTGYDYEVVDNVFGYDYVLHLDFLDTLTVPTDPTEYTYSVYELNEDSQVKTVHLEKNQEANAWKYESGGALIDNGTFGYIAGLSDAEIGNGLVGADNDDVHNAISFDLGFLDEAVLGTMKVTSTLQCGNDKIVGDPAVPEPGTLLLLGSGLLGFLAWSRKRFEQ